MIETKEKGERSERRKRIEREDTGMREREKRKDTKNREREVEISIWREETWRNIRNVGDMADVGGDK